MNADRRRQGFTLIEVLVALAIVAFGLVAVFGQMSQSANSVNRLREKTLAEWVATNAIAELRLSGQYPGVGTRSDDVEMGGRRWRWEMKVSETEGDYMRRVDVSVTDTDSRDRPVATVAGFIPQPSTAPRGLPPPDPDGGLGGDADDGGDPALAGGVNGPPPEPTPETAPPPSGNDNPGAEQ